MMGCANKIAVLNAEKGEYMLTIKKGDYFDLFQEGQPTKRVVCYSPIYNKHYCHAVDINDLDSAGYMNKVYIVDFENEVETVLGNIFE